MLELFSSANTPLESAIYDENTGDLNLVFSWDALLDEDGAFANARHIDGLTIGDELGVNDNVYEIEIHADDGPRDEDGSFIYSEETMVNEFTINIGEGIDVFGETLSFGLTDNADGTGELYEFQLVEAEVNEEVDESSVLASTDVDESSVLAGTDAVDVFTLTPTSDDGIVTITDLSNEDIVQIGDDRFDGDYVYQFGRLERSLNAEVDTALVGDGDGEQVLLFGNSAEDGEFASFDELFAVINIASDGETAGSNVLVGTDAADTYTLTPSADDGVVTVTDFGLEDSIIFTDPDDPSMIDQHVFDGEELYFSAYAGRSLSQDVDSELIGEGDSQQIVLSGNSSGPDEIASFDEVFAVIDVSVEDGWIV